MASKAAASRSAAEVSGGGVGGRMGKVTRGFEGVRRRLVIRLKGFSSTLRRRDLWRESGGSGVSWSEEMGVERRAFGRLIQESVGVHDGGEEVRVRIEVRKDSSALVDGVEELVVVKAFVWGLVNFGQGRHVPRHFHFIRYDNLGRITICPQGVNYSVFIKKRDCGMFYLSSHKMYGTM